MPSGKRKTTKRTSSSARSSTPSRPGSVGVPLAALARAFRGLKVPWYLFGAQAVAVHGVPRATADVDVTVVGVDDPLALIRALARQGIICRTTDRSFLEAAQVLPCLHRSTGWQVDVVLGHTGLERLLAEQAVTRAIGKAQVPVVRLEHLVVLKILAGRPRDLGDVARLLEAHPSTLDAAEVESLLGELEAALAEGGLIARFHAARG